MATNLFCKKTPIVLWCSTLLIAGCSERFEAGSVPVPAVEFPKVSGEPRRFKDCSDAKAYIAKGMEVWQREQDRYSEWLRSSWRSVYSNADMIAAVPAARDSVTNIQERDVDEGDKVKTSPDHVFVAQQSKLQIIDRRTRKLSRVLDLGDLNEPELYWEAGILVAIGRTMSGEGIVAKFYSIEVGGVPKLLERKAFTGKLVGSRLIGNRLFLVLQNRGLTSTSFEAGGVHGVSCANLVGPFLPDFDFRFTSVFSLDLERPGAEPHSMAFIGGGDHLYVSRNSLYIVKQGIHWFHWDPRAEQNQLREQTLVTRIGFDTESGRIEVAGIGAIRGRLRNRLAMKEFEENRVLSIATTYSGSDFVEANRVWLLDLASEKGWMKVRSKSVEFGRGEDIRSVSYIGSRAYVVTFEKTDPLFVFDLANPDRIELQSELKVPGFSSYLHEVADSGLLGVGYEATDQGSFSLAQGLQVSLFDVSDPGKVSVVRQRSVGTRGSYLPVTDDPHSFFYDRSRHRAFVPMMVQYGAPWEDGLSVPNIVDNHGGDVDFRSGALVVDLKTGIESEVFLSHFDLIPRTCETLQKTSRWWQETDARSLDVDRVFELDGKLVSVSYFGVMFRDLEDPQRVEKEIVFADAENACRSFVQRRYGSYGGS